MKRLVITFIFCLSFYLFLSHIACDNHPVTIPVPPPTATPTSTPIHYQISVLAGAFSPDPVTIQAGEVVVWTNLDAGGAHAIQTDDGTGLCQSINSLNFLGAALTITFSTPATINYHDWYNCPAGSGACNFAPFPGNYGCDGTCAALGNMTGTIFVQ